MTFGRKVPVDRFFDKEMILRNRDFVPMVDGLELRLPLSDAGPEYYPEDARFPAPADVQPDPPPDAPPPAPVQQVDPFEDPFAPAPDHVPGGSNPADSADPSFPPDA